MLFLCLLSCSYDFYPPSLFIKHIGLYFSFCVVSFYGLDMSRADLIEWSKFVREGFKSRASVSWSQLALPDQSPSGDLPLQCGSPELGCLMWDLHPLLFREQLRFCNILPTVSTWGWGPWKDCLCRFHLSQHGSPSFLWKCCSVNTSLEVLLGETCSLYSCSFGVSVGGSELRIIRL